MKANTSANILFSGRIVTLATTLLCHELQLLRQRSKNKTSIKAYDE